MLRIRSRPAATPSVLGLMLLFVLSAPMTAAPADEGSPSPPQEVFEALCARIEQSAAELPANAAAGELCFALRKELIRSDAEIEILKLEAARFEGAEQARALDRLVAAAAARERQLLAAVRRLEKSAAMPADFSPTPAASEPAAAEAAPGDAMEAAETAEAAEAPEDEGEPRPEKRHKRELEVRFEPADMIDDPPP